VADILVVLPTFNEIDNLESILGRIRQAVPNADVLVIDDSSPDGTGDLAERLAESDPGVSVMHRTGPAGLGSAYLAGFRRAIDDGYAYVVEMDADGSHNPSSLPAMIGLARAGADLVIGSRWVRGGQTRNWPWVRRAISRGGNLYSRLLLGSRIRDLTSGFRVYHATALLDVDPSTVSSQGYCFQVELAWRLERSGAVVIEYPITFVERTLGNSKMHAGIVAEALWRVTLWGIGRARRETSPAA
jgi:dolichol-phosphate mannosyltransferase